MDVHILLDPQRITALHLQTLRTAQARQAGMNHTEHGTYRGCQQCNRTHEALDVAAGTFGCLVLFTACPLTVLFVIAAHGVASTAGAWAAAGFLAALPGLAGLWSYWRGGR